MACVPPTGGADRVAKNSAREAAAFRSFDLFDTLVTRTWFYPEDLMLAVGERLRAQGLWPGSAAAFLEARTRSERDLRKRAGRREVTLEDIYAALFPDADARRRGMKIEIEEELLAIRPMACMRERWLEVPLEQRVVISDTYLPREAVLDILRRNGVEAPEHQVFVSSDSGLTKHHGNLYGEVAAKLGTRPEAISHIGDNLHSDYRQAVAAAVQAEHFDRGRATRYERILRGRRTSRSVARSLIGKAARLARLSGPAGEDRHAILWLAATNIIGPVLLGYVLWCLARVEQAGSSQILFGARDAQILYRIAGRLADAGVISAPLKYVDVSRRALFTADFVNRGGRVPDWVLEDTAGMPLRRAYGLFGGDAPEGEGDEILPRSRARLRAWYRTRAGTEFLSFADARAQVAAQGLRRYLEALQIGDGDRVAFVDLGWRGRMQQALAPFMAERGAELQGFYFSMRPSGLHRPLREDSGAAALLFARFIERLGPLSIEMFEVFCRADHGGVLGYDAPEASGVHTRRGPPPGPEELADIEVVQAGILAFTDTLLSSTAAHGIAITALAGELKSGGLAVMHEFLRRPSEREAHVWGGITHSPLIDDARPRAVGESNRGIDVVASQIFRRLPKYCGGSFVRWPGGAAAVRPRYSLVRALTRAVYDLKRLAMPCD